MSNQELTIRENEVIAFLAKGLLNKEIAEILNITVRTVDTHLYSIYKKLQVKNRIEALNAKTLKKEQTMNKITAVEWLLQRFEDGDMYNVEDAQFIKHQALAMEKEQIEGAKWQTDRMYSEEDMEEAFTNGLNRSFDSDFDRWFEQFKKKDA